MYIVIKEVFPKAVRWDPTDQVVTLFFSTGMIVMCLSLVAIKFT